MREIIGAGFMGGSFALITANPRVEHVVGIFFFLIGLHFWHTGVHREH